MPDTKFDPFAALVCYVRRFASAEELRFVSLTWLRLCASVAAREFHTDPVAIDENVRWRLVRALGGAAHV